MNGIDIFYDVVLPDFFTLNHQVGTVLGRASYSDGFSFIQNCTVGENFGKWPTIGQNVCMCAGSSIIGNSIIGDNVMVGAGAKVLGNFTVGSDSKIAAGAVVLGPVPENSTAVGIPAHIVRRDGKKVSKIDLDQVHIPDPVSQELCVLTGKVMSLETKIKSLEEELKCAEAAASAPGESAPAEADAQSKADTDVG